jgi:hypothetical protein
VTDGSRNFTNIAFESDFSGISFFGHASMISQIAGKRPHFMTQ